MRTRCDLPASLRESAKQGAQCFLRNFFLTRFLRDAYSSITGHLDTSHTEKESIGNTYADAERLGSRRNILRVNNYMTLSHTIFHGGSHLCV